MVFTRQFAVGFFDLISASRSFYAENFVVVLEFQVVSPRPISLLPAQREIRLTCPHQHLPRRNPENGYSGTAYREFCARV